MSARPIHEILGDARSELLDRESKLTAIIDQAKAELREVQAALRKVGGGNQRPAMKASNGNGSRPRRPQPEQGAMRERILGELDSSLEPLTPGEIAARFGAEAHKAAGIASSLRFLEREGKVVRVENGWGLPANVDTETSSGALRD